MSDKKKTTAPVPVKTRGIGRKKTFAEQFLVLSKRILSQFGTAILAVAIVAYVFLQLMLNVGTLIDTETAAYANIVDKVELEAFLFRDEFLIPSGADGTDCFLALDGEKVRKGQNVAITYSDENDVAIQKRISEIDARIDVLERSSLSTGASTTNIALIDSGIDQLVLEMVRRADDNEFDKILRKQEELLILMNRRQAITQSHSYTVELSTLSHERKTLVNSLSGLSFTTRAPKSGYFYSNVDGYENIFTVKKLENLTGEEFEALSDSSPDQSIIENSSGKIVLSSTWYIAVGVNKRVAETFKDGRTYPITFQYSNNTEINMTLERRIARTDKDITVLVFSTKQMPSGFDYSRCQTIELPCEEYEGIKISTSSLRMQDGKTGVYVVIGTKVVFKETEVLYNYGGYSVCAIPKNPAYPNRRDIEYSSKTKLSLHDSVVTNGTDIYDGMRIH